MTFKKRTGGTWSDITAPKRRSGGVWVTPTAVKVREGGVWVTVWPTGGPPSPSATLSNHTIRSESLRETNPFPPPAELRTPGRSTYVIYSGGTDAGYAMDDAYDGFNTEVGVGFGTWLTGGSASDVQVRATVTSGAVTAGSATGTWLSMASDQFWRAATGSNVTVDGTNAVLTIELRNATTLAILATATVTLAQGPVYSIT